MKVRCVSVIKRDTEKEVKLANGATVMDIGDPFWEAEFDGEFTHVRLLRLSERKYEIGKEYTLTVS